MQTLPMTLSAESIIQEGKHTHLQAKSTPQVKRLPANTLLTECKRFNRLLPVWNTTYHKISNWKYTQVLCKGRQHIDYGLNAASRYRITTAPVFTLLPNTFVLLLKSTPTWPSHREPSQCRLQSTQLFSTAGFIFLNNNNICFWFTEFKYRDIFSLFSTYSEFSVLHFQRYWTWNSWEKTLIHDKTHRVSPLPPTSISTGGSITPKTCQSIRETSKAALQAPQASRV